MNGYIRTATGQYFNFNQPETHNFTIEEIAFSLSNLCRYTGHVEFYSVAQHSVLVSHIVPKRFALVGLLHDAAEAYLGDVASPLKAMLADYKKVEKRVEAAIASHFGLQFPFPPEVKYADMRMLMTEKRDLMPEIPEDAGKWPDHLKCVNYTVRPMVPVVARTYFLNRYNELTKGE
jgi:hypothetical protein